MITIERGKTCGLFILTYGLLNANLNMLRLYLLLSFVHLLYFNNYISIRF